MKEKDIAELLRRCGLHNVSVRVRHALERAEERNASIHDIVEALRHHTSLVAQPRERWKACGPDLDGVDLWVVFVVEDEIVVITVY